MCDRDEQGGEEMSRFVRRTAFCFSAALAIAVVAAVPAVRALAVPQSLEEAAKQEGTVVVYGSIESETMDAVKKAFVQKYGVSVDYWRGASNKVLDRALTEFRSSKPSFDVVLTNHGPMQLLKKQGVFAKYLSPQNANFPASVKDPDNVLSPVYRLAVVGILYNTRLLRPEDVPKGLEDFLTPKWRGKWVIPDPTQHFTTGQWLRNLEKLYGPDWLALVRKLGETKPILVESFIPSAQKIISGEALAGISYVKYVQLYGKEGAPIDYVRLPKTLAEGHTAAISARAAHPSAAKLFENFLISREGMEIMARQGEFVTAKGIFPPIKDADKINTVAIDELSSEEFTKWAAVFRPLFVAR
jgi:iron(III) transport system substrate-binding protein